VASDSALGRIYLYGRGVPPDYSKALVRERKAADQGDPRARLKAVHFSSWLTLQHRQFYYSVQLKACTGCLQIEKRDGALQNNLSCSWDFAVMLELYTTVKWLFSLFLPICRRQINDNVDTGT
jgi:TPR repeat protein